MTKGDLIQLLVYWGMAWFAAGWAARALWSDRRQNKGRD
jgi:hypothetical protein